MRMRQRSRAATTALALVLVLSGPTAEGRQESPRSPRNASYSLRARLDPATRTITGTGALTWRNVSANPATELRFHMYWNAWRDRHSSWMREQSLGRNRTLADRPAEDRASIDLTSLRLRAPAEDLLARARFIAPDDGNAEDRTVMAVPLARPVAPGDTIVVEFGWTARVPRTFARTGTLGSYFFIAQWFPKIGVLEDGGWNARQFHAATEFFADFGSYDVELTVPTGWIVGATGAERARVENSDGTTTHRYGEDDVHDFAWTTSPHFIESTRIFDEPGLPKVRMRLLLQPEHQAQADRHFSATRETLARFGRWFGAYPYTQLTIVDPVPVLNPAVQGGSTGGMEYPTLFTAGTRWFAPRRVPAPEGVTVHEAGHQFWYGVVATNEFDHAWMDEGLTTYATAKVMDDAFPGRFVAAERYLGGLIVWSYEDVVWSRDRDGNRLSSYRAAIPWDASSTPTWQQWPGTAGAATYDKTALWLTTLERKLGWDTMQRVLSTYFSRGAFRHPTPDEFFATANEVSGQDLTPFFDAVYRSSETFDYAVADVTTVALDSGSFDTTVVTRRIGDGIFPVDVRIAFTDGSEVVERWDGTGRWRTWRYRRTARPAQVEVDPGRVLALDLNVTNNSWTASPQAADAARALALRWWTWFDHVLLTYAFFV
jgi:hypothetical protein